MKALTRRCRSRLTLPLLVGLASTLALATPADAAFPGRNGKIAYSCGSPGPICTVNPDGAQRAMLTPIASSNSDPAWSPDGTKVAFTYNSVRGFYSGNNAEIYVVAADGTGLTPLTVNTVDDEDPAWSPDGKKIVFTSNLGDPDPAGCVQRHNCLFDLHVMNSDGSHLAQLTGGRIDVREFDPSWEPNGSRIAYYCEQNIFPFSKGICLVNSDGTGIRYLGSGQYPNWAPDGSKIAFTAYSANGNSQTFTMNPDGSGRTLVPSREQFHVFGPGWSPDKARIADAYQGCGTPSGGCNPLVLETRNVDGTDPINLSPSELRDNSQPDWQPIPITGYARPKGATPVLTSLAIAFKPCASPNRTHGAPLSGGSCNPPAQTSDYLTVGTLDANQEQPNSTGSVRYDVRIGNPSTPADEADVNLAVSITDVRAKSDLSDYSGELSVDAQRRITDKDNTPSPDGGTGAATVQDIPFAFTVPCTPTSDKTIGSSCAVATTADALVPGSVKEGMRSIWELSQIQVYDGGADGDADTSADNTLFMDEGIFTP